MVAVSLKKKAFCVPSFFVTHPPRLIFSSATKQQHRQLLEFIAEVELELHHHYVWFEYLKKEKGIIPVYSLQELDAIGAAGQIAEALQVHEQFPLLRSLMVFYDASDRPYELAFNYYRTDRCKLSMVRTLNEG